MTEDNEQATLSENPVVTEASMPDEAYKGLQRELSKRDRQIRDLQKQINDTVQSSVSATGEISEEADRIIKGLIAVIGQNDQGLAQAALMGYEQHRLKMENERLKAAPSKSAPVEDNDEDLRALAVDLGADPDSPLIDYGDSSMSYSQRVSLTRRTARAAAAPASPVQPSPRTAGPVLQPGVGSAVATRDPDAPMDEEAFQSLKRRYTAAHGGEKNRLYNELRAEMQRRENKISRTYTPSLTV